jgi:hypothetical protein
VRLTGRRTSVLTWAERDALLAQLARTAGAGPIVKAFETVGATRPVELDESQKLALLGAIWFWESRRESGRLQELMPYGVLLLRDALARDLRLD